MEFVWRCRREHRPPLLPLLALMFGVLLFVIYVPETFMWRPRMFGIAR